MVKLKKAGLKNYPVPPSEQTTGKIGKPTSKNSIAIIFAITFLASWLTWAGYSGIIATGQPGNIAGQ
ncbi:MAG: hypothetical protein WAV28_10900 [Sedimentisphaerales bacterium]|jgi:hypothetical protein